ncbi:MAG: hypothetical protein QM703_22910 [Gemmatales bacterium]
MTDDMYESLDEATNAKNKLYEQMVNRVEFMRNMDHKSITKALRAKLNKWFKKINTEAIELDLECFDLDELSEIQEFLSEMLFTIATCAEAGAELTKAIPKPLNRKPAKSGQNVKRLNGSVGAKKKPKTKK